MGMLQDRRVLVVGDQSTLARADLGVLDSEVELVDSIAEAAARYASGGYSRIVVDPTALRGMEFEILASPCEPPSRDEPSLPSIPPSPPEADDEPRLAEASVVGGPVVGQDTTECKGAEGELARQRELLQGIIDNIPVMLCIWDPHLQSFRFNKHFRDVFGYTEEDTLDGEFMSKVYPDPEYRQMVIEFMQALDPGWRDLKTTAKDGTAIDCSWANVRLSDDTAIGIGIDIRERRKTEEALRESEERFRAVVDGLPLIVWVHDAEGDQLLVNRTFCEFFGITDDEMRGGRWRMLVHPDDAPSYVGEFQSCVAERRPFHAETRVKRADGEWRWLESWGRPRFSDSGQFLGFVGSSADITERKGAESVLGKYQLLTEHSRDIFLFVRRDGRIIEANRAAVNAYGYTRDELLGMTIFQLRAQEARQDVQAHMVQADEHGVLFETVHRRRNGTEFPVEVSSRGGDIGGDRVLMSIIRDITDRKHAEHEQQALLEREHHIAQTLQQALIPPSVPQEIGGYRFGVTYRPALTEAEIGGDFYDIFELGDDKVGILIGDVAGKGLTAAVQVAAVRYAARGYAYLDPRPSRVLALVNEALVRTGELVGGMLTAFFAVLDVGLGTLVYASAGHEPPIAVAAGGQWEELGGPSLPLGIVMDVTYAEGSRRMDVLDRVVMVTDGITEAMDQSRELFGKERLVSYVLENASVPSADLADSILAAAQDYAGGSLHDDAAIVVVERVW